jgi:hypothetical protein
MFIEQDLSGAIKAARHRFAACKEANQILKSQAVTNSEDEEKQKKNQPRQAKVFECHGCVFPECGDCIPELDCSPDCGSCGGELDCSPDCGSCGG